MKNTHFEGELSLEGAARDRAINFRGRDYSSEQDFEYRVVIKWSSHDPGVACVNKADDLRAALWPLFLTAI